MAAVHDKFESWFGKLTEAVYQRKYVALILMLLMTVGLASQISKITIDTRDEGFFYDDDPALVAYNNFRDQFGQDDTFIIALQPKNGLNREFFKNLFALHHELEDQSPYIDEIKSLVNGRIVRATGETLYVEKLMDKPPQTEAEVARVRKLINRYPLYEDLLISKDRSLVSILIRAKAVRQQSTDLMAGFEADLPPPPSDKKKYLSNAESIEITNAIEKVLKRYQDKGLTIYFSGTPAVVATLQKNIVHDMSIMIPLSLVLIVLFLILLFRRVSGLVYPLVVVIFSLLATLGAMAVLGIPITLVSQILPSFLLLAAIAVHEHRYSKLPPFSSDFYPAPASPPAEEKPADNLENTGLAFEVQGIFTGWDVSLYGAHIYNDQLTIVPSPSTVGEHRRISMAGAALNAASGNFLYILEAAHFRGLRFMADYHRDYARTDLLAGIEYRGFTDTTISVDLLNRHLHHFRSILAYSPESPQRDQAQAALRITRELLNNQLTLTALLIVQGERAQDGAMQRFTAKYDLVDNWSMTGGAIFYQSGVGAMANAGNNDRLFLEIRLDF